MLLLSDSSVDELLTLSGIVDSDLLSLSHNVCFSLFFSLSHRVDDDLLSLSESTDDDALSLSGSAVHP